MSGVGAATFMCYSLSFSLLVFLFADARERWFALVVLLSMIPIMMVDGENRVTHPFDVTVVVVVSLANLLVGIACVVLKHFIRINVEDTELETEMMRRDRASLFTEEGFGEAFSRITFEGA